MSRKHTAKAEKLAAPGRGGDKLNAEQRAELAARAKDRRVDLLKELSARDATRRLLETHELGGATLQAVEEVMQHQTIEVLLSHRSVMEVLAERVAALRDEIARLGGLARPGKKNVEACWTALVRTLEAALDHQRRTAGVVKRLSEVRASVAKTYLANELDRQISSFVISMDAWEFPAEQVERMEAAMDGLEPQQRAILLAKLDEFEALRRTQSTQLN